MTDLKARAVAIIAFVRSLFAINVESAWTLGPDTRAKSDARSTAEAGAAVVGSVGLAGLVKQYLIGGTLYQTSLSTIEFIDGFATSFFSPLRAFLDGLSRSIAAVFPVRLFNAGVAGSSRAVGDMGIVAFPVAVAVGIGGMYLFMTALRRLDFSPIDSIYGRFNQ